MHCHKTIPIDHCKTKGKDVLKSRAIELKDDKLYSPRRIVVRVDNEI